MVLLTPNLGRTPAPPILNRLDVREIDEKSPLLGQAFVMSLGSHLRPHQAKGGARGGGDVKMKAERMLKRLASVVEDHPDIETKRVALTHLIPAIGLKVSCHT